MNTRAWILLAIVAAIFAAFKIAGNNTTAWNPKADFYVEKDRINNFIDSLPTRR